MRSVRLALGPLVSVWLTCQLAAAGLTPLALSAGSADVNAVQCTCGQGVHATCPTHHRPAPGSKICVMRGTSDQATLLTSLFGIVGLMPGSTPLLDRAPSGRLAIIESQMTAEHPVPPDPPPPRV
jgi:hypothetical protein